MLVELKNKLVKGIEFKENFFRIKKISDGRFKEEENFVFYLNKTPIFNFKIFYGRRPDYREWIEIFMIRDKNYFGSDSEEKTISLFYQYLEKGARIFIEYEDDKETFKELEKGIPEVLSRMGFLLFKSNFIYIKNLYFPEGFMEGGRKLKAEKSLSEKDYLREREKISEEVKIFLENRNFEIENEIYKRAREILTISHPDSVGVERRSYGLK